MSNFTTDLTPLKVVNISERDILVKYDGREYGILKPGKAGVYGGPVARLAAKNIINSKIIDDNQGKEVLPLNDVDLRAELADKVLFEVELEEKRIEQPVESKAEASAPKTVATKSSSEIESMTYPELIRYARKLGVEFEKKGTKRPQLVELIEEHLANE